LEEEAGWLAGREELQRELVDMAARVEARGLRLRELEQQRLQAAQSAQEESCAMERQLLSYLRRLEEVRLTVCTCSTLLSYFIKHAKRGIC
jgi:chromatin segregation and condensation protein Rec8/ScpA/Scc1 (kleisin family)